MDRARLMPVRNIAMDLGTGNTLVFVEGEGIALNEPSVVAVERASQKVIAIGSEAKRMLGRTPDEIKAIRPMKDGVIADVDITEVMLRHFLNHVTKSRRIRTKPRLVVGVPSGITELERRAVRSSARQAGASDVFMVAEPMAAAIGCGMPVDTPQACMVIDIGCGSTDIACIALSGIVSGESIRTAGDEIDQAIMTNMRQMHGMHVGETTAEQVKMRIGSAWPIEEELTMEVKGRDMAMGIPKTVTVTSQQVREWIRPVISQIVDAVKLALEKTPPELSADIMEYGIIMTGGGALIRGLDKLISHETGLRIHVDQDPLTCVARGAAMILDNFEKYKPVLTE